jgi:peptidoglycan hydrolase CwlO-like protein
MKRLYALIAAAIITGLVGLGMLAIGVNAAINPNTVAASDAPGDPATNVSATSPDAQAQVRQLQDLVAQYQDREKQYQAQLNQEETQLQQYQQLLIELQRRGLIRINGDGSIQLSRRGLGGGG